MNKTIGNPIYYYYRTDEEPGRVIASLHALRETATLDYIGKRYFFTDRYHSVSWRYDQPPVFFDHKAAAGCFAACHDTNVTTYEVDSPLTGTFLLHWAYEAMNAETKPKHGDIVFTDDEGTMTLTFKRDPKKKRIELSFQRMIVENHQWDEKYFDPILTFCDKRFEANERWYLSLDDWHELVVPLGKNSLTNPMLSFRDEADFDEDVDLSFEFRYLDRRFLVPKVDIQGETESTKPIVGYALLLDDDGNIHEDEIPLIRNREKAVRKALDLVDAKFDADDFVDWNNDSKDGVDIITLETQRQSARNLNSCRLNEHEYLYILPVYDEETQV